MTKVNVDVQVLVTGPTGSGKGLVMNRIREALGDMVSNRVAQIEGFEREYADGGLFKLKGELANNAGPKAPKETHSNVPGYPDSDKMIENLIASVERAKVLLNAAYGHSVSKPKTKPFVVRVDGLSGALYEYKADHAMSPGCRLITLNLATADAPTDPVGMDQVETQTVCLQPSEDPAPGLGFLTGGYVPRCGIIEPKLTLEQQLEQAELRYEAELRNSQALEKVVKEYQERKVIKLTKAEIQSGISRVKWAESLIRQLPSNHDGRNSWLLNYGQKGATIVLNGAPSIQAGIQLDNKSFSLKGITITGEGQFTNRGPINPNRKTGAPKDHAHTKANDALLMLNPSIAEQFQPLTDFDYVSSAYPGGLVAGNKVQVIFADGTIGSGTVDSFAWHKVNDKIDIVYWRRM